MFATQIRPVTDLRNHYAEVEKDLCAVTMCFVAWDIADTLWVATL